MDEIKQFDNTELDKLPDSAFLAYVLSHLFKNEKNEFVSESIFNRITKILETMSKEEMI